MEPPIIVRNNKNKDKFPPDLYKVIPDVFMLVSTLIKALFKTS